MPVRRGCRWCKSAREAEADTLGTNCWSKYIQRDCWNSRTGCREQLSRRLWDMLPQSADSL